MTYKYSYTNWIPFEQIYHWDKTARSRSSTFKPVSELITRPVAGIYLIADANVGSLKSPESLIYIGKTSGKTKWAAFHDRLWKHCCKAIGECGGKFQYVDGVLKKDYADKSQPQDTENWAAYRYNHFQGFSSWYFSFYQLDEPDFEKAKEKIGLIEDITMYAFSYYANPQKALCNGSSPQLSVKFPWVKG